MRWFVAVMSVVATLGTVALAGCQKANKSPGIPSVPSGPSVGRADTAYGFTSSAADPDGDSVAIRFDWGDGDTSDWSAWEASGGSPTASHSWSDSGTFLVKAQAKDEDDATSDWSAGHQISVGAANEPPYVPATPAGPDAGSTSTEYAFAGSTEDPDGDSVAIRFDWGDDDTSDWSSWAASGDSIATTHSWSDSGSYSIKAQAKDAKNATSDWSSGHQMVISGAGGSGWPRTYGGSADDVGRSVDVCTDGGYIIAGYTSSYGIGTPDIYLVKTDSLGNEQWNKTLGGNSYDSGHSVQQTTDGGYIIAGSTTSGSPAWDWQIYFAKLFADGRTEWEKLLGGYESEDAAYSVQQTRDGGYILVGYTLGNEEDLRLIKRHADGSDHWWYLKGFNDSDERGWSVQQTSDDGYIMVGSTNQYGDDVDVWLVKAAADGGTQWHKPIFLGSGQGYECGYSVQQTSDGGYIIAGSTNSAGTAGGYDVYLIKTDGDGNRVWQRTFGGQYDDKGRSVEQMLDGGYIVAGCTKSLGAGGYDVYLIKTDAGGDTVWTRTFGGTGDDVGYSVERDGQNCIIAGYTTSAANGKDAYLIKIDANGNVVKSSPSRGLKEDR